MGFGIPGQANGMAGCFPTLPEPLAELQILFILITNCKVQDYVVTTGRSKGRGTLAHWPSQDAAHSSMLNILDYFFDSLLITVLCCIAKQQMRHCSLAGHISLDWLPPFDIIKK